MHYDTIFNLSIIYFSHNWLWLQVTGWSSHEGHFYWIFPVVSDKETGILSTKSEEDDFKEENSYIYYLMYREEQVKEGNYLEI